MSHCLRLSESKLSSTISTTQRSRVSYSKFKEGPRRKKNSIARGTVDLSKLGELIQNKVSELFMRTTFERSRSCPVTIGFFRNIMKIQVCNTTLIFSIYHFLKDFTSVLHLAQYIPNKLGNDSSKASAGD